MSAPVSEGDVVLDKYRVERVLGRGGMGVVVAATHIELDHRVALKFLLPEALQHREIVERFAREARAAAKIQSQHVARVIDTGRMPSGAPFMVMEYLDGRDLADVLEQDGPLEPGVAVSYVLQACEAIAEAHAAGIVHRDLKPSNLFLANQRDRRAIVKVLDFGISKLRDPKSAALTQTATMMGSPHYMSPEQLTSSKDVDARTDIWSLGVILYELVSGRRPFEAETMPEIVALILRNQPERLGTMRPGISLDLELAIARCLASSVRDRYPTIAALAAAIRPLSSDVEAAQASVGRISRVLGGVSLPPHRSGGEVSESVATSATVALGSAMAPGAVAAVSVTSGAGAPLAETRSVAVVPVTAASPHPGSRRRRAPIAALAGALVLGGGVFIALRVTSSGPRSPGEAADLTPALGPASAARARARDVASASGSVQRAAAAGAVHEAGDSAAEATSAAPPSDSSSRDDHLSGSASASASAPALASSPTSVKGHATRLSSTARTGAPATNAPSASAASKSPLNMGIK